MIRHYDLRIALFASLKVRLRLGHWPRTDEEIFYGEHDPTAEPLLKRILVLCDAKRLSIGWH